MCLPPTSPLPAVVLFCRNANIIPCVGAEMHPLGLLWTWVKPPFREMELSFFPAALSPALASFHPCPGSEPQWQIFPTLGFFSAYVEDWDC